MCDIPEFLASLVISTRRDASQTTSTPGRSRVRDAARTIGEGIRRGSPDEPELVVEARSLQRVFVDGYVVNTLNPKTAISVR